jgi:hypothetical protein
MDNVKETLEIARENLSEMSKVCVIWVDKNGILQSHFSDMSEAEAIWMLEKVKFEIL